MGYVKALAVAACLSCLISCTNGNESVGSGESDLESGQTHFSAITDEHGIATFSLPLSSLAASFQATVFSNSTSIRLVALKDPQGQDVTLASTEVTRQSDPFAASPHSTNYPYVSGVILDGVYTARYQLTGDVDDAELNLILTTKSDSDLRNGTLRVNLSLIGPVGASTDTTASLKDALEVWRQIYSSAGVLLDDKWYQFDGPQTLPDPRSGDPFYSEIVQKTRANAVNLVFGSQLTGLKAPDSKYGLVGSIPGPFSLSAKGVVAISVLALTGPDGRFNYWDTGSTQVHNDETRLAAEEMSRLTARYLGLEHIVVFQGNKVVADDSLPDTSSCLTITACRSYREVRSNGMFPFPLDKNRSPYDRDEDQGREFWPRDTFTESQRLALNRSVFVD